MNNKINGSKTVVKKRRPVSNGVKDKELVAYALKTMKNAYAPYSKYKVGAALLTKGGAKRSPDSHRGGRVYTGCNIENASYGLTVCAERVAVFKAVSEGEQGFRKMAIVTSGKDIATPCGACLQVMAEFNPNLTLLLANKQGKVTKQSLKKLLTHPFHL